MYAQVVFQEPPAKVWWDSKERTDDLLLSRSKHLRTKPSIRASSMGSHGGACRGGDLSLPIHRVCSFTVFLLRNLVLWNMSRFGDATIARCSMWLASRFFLSFLVFPLYKLIYSVLLIINNIRLRASLD